MIESPCIAGDTPISETGIGYTLSLINGRYKIMILYWLSVNSVMRFNQLKRHIEKISFKTLSNTLKELERDELVIRKEYPQIPPKVEYRLSMRGRSLLPIIDAMCEWGENNR
ncbi:helix-turn-helix transcriptional regulator [Ignatzschineria rhizosphaerae]|uniref:Helix-turn-helix transcriptional regulator n=1 Tax=Ignatzschineria rhizosphaerae TaxID=2923279 RepID=A0ABY3X4G1_9GAMM|nr:helix-turn-helix domain-containing protein [Ignatzschineria rhizosphaerae]UNM96574.1 helix-turn-helix transcriptional regulator [Ignatzschineria rhizosphaerae]